MSSSHSDSQGTTTTVPFRFPKKSGISLKPAYFHRILDEKPEVGFFEIHAENYLSPGGPARYYLEQIRQYYPITVHGVGLSIGGEEPLNINHLNKVVDLVNRVEPIAFSEHLAWSSHSEHYLNDLLPLPYTKETLLHVCEHIDQVQNALKRSILLENPSTYIAFKHNDYSEVDFLTEIVRQTGCQLLLDVNNVEVSCFNHDNDPKHYLTQFPLSDVGQIHLAGYTLDQNGPIPLKIDSHDNPVSSEVWDLYRWVQTERNAIPTLIEWDSDLPTLHELCDQAHQADQVILSTKAPYAKTV